MAWAVTFIVCSVLSVHLAKTFVLQGYDPNATPNWGLGNFNPNAGQGSTIPPPTSGKSGANSKSATGSSGGYNFGNSQWGYGTGPNGFNPNAGYSTIPPPVTYAPSSNSFGNLWGFGTGSGGFNPNAGYSTVAPPMIPTSAAPTVATQSMWGSKSSVVSTRAPVLTTAPFWNFGGSFSSGSTTRQPLGSNAIIGCGGFYKLFNLL